MLLKKIIVKEKKDNENENQIQKETIIPNSSTEYIIGCGVNLKRVKKENNKVIFEKVSCF